MGVSGNPLFINPDPNSVVELEFCIKKIRVWNTIRFMSNMVMLGWSTFAILTFIFSNNITSAYIIGQFVFLAIYFAVIALAKSKLNHYNVRILVAAQNILKPIDPNVIDVESHEIES